MTKFDKEYLELVKRILIEGVEVENRTGINTIKIPKYMFEFDLSKEFPILQSKQFFVRQAITEMLWIWQMQSNDVRELQARNVHIWDKWMVDEDGIYRIYEPKIEGKNYEFDPDREVVVLDPLSVPASDPFGHSHELKPKYDDNGKVMKAKSLVSGENIKMAKYYGREYANTIGTAYGYLTNKYQLTQDMQNILRNLKTERRGVYSLWQNEFLRTAVLPSCVWSVECDVTDNKLNFWVHQRSCDVPLGLPFNVTQYSTLLMMMAQVTGMEPGVLSYSIKDAHIYVNQVDMMWKQVDRWNKYEEMKTWNYSKVLERQLHLSDMLEFKRDFLSEEEIENIDSELKIIDIILDPKEPYLWLNPEVKDFFDFDNSLELRDCKVKNYKHMGKIKMPLAQ